jgi:integrase
VTLAKAYRLLRTICETAVSDEMIGRNPRKLKGASVEHSPERPVATVAQVGEIFQAIEARYAAKPLLAAWCGLRLGEALALTRDDIDLGKGTIRIDKSAAELQSGERIIGPPKTEAGIRTVAMPPHVVPLVEEHLRVFTGPAGGDLVFVGTLGQPVRHASFYTAWVRATASNGTSGLRYHDRMAQFLVL